MRSLVALAAITAALALTAASTAATETHWYWTPGLCKSKGTNAGLNLGGSSLRILSMRCYGLQQCWISNGVIRYDHFLAFALDGNGVVRSFKVAVTGKETGSFTDMRVWKGTSWDNLEYALGAAGVRPVDSSTCVRGDMQGA